MAMKGHIPGGGIASNKITERPVRTGAGAKAAQLGGVSQLGNKVGNHITDDKNTGYTGERLFAGRGYNPTQYGNEIAAKTVCGPGGSRKVYGSGSQQQYGSGGAPKPSGRDILSSFGPESSRRDES